MIKVIIKTTSVRREITANLSDTPRSLFDEQGIDIESGIINLDGAPLCFVELNKPLGELGIAEGAICSLNCIVKAYGG